MVSPSLVESPLIVSTIMTSESENSADDAWIVLSNGFKNRHTASSQNSNNDNYVYMAFAENPIVDSTGKIPATAR